MITSILTTLLLVAIVHIVIQMVNRQDATLEISFSTSLLFGVSTVKQELEDGDIRVFQLCIGPLVLTLIYDI